jgi:DeoR/GlpR family transcriptional regulator of sugar metabolism
MIPIVRRSEIKKMMYEKREVTVKELSTVFSVSEETIRRDLHALENEGIVTRTYGGAVLQRRVKNIVDRKIVEGLFVESKTIIAKRCAELIKNGDCIFLDSSSTALHICDEIMNLRLTVITNSYSVSTRLVELDNIMLICTGGSIDRTDYSFTGRSVTRFLSDYYVDKSFVSCSSIDMERGLSDFNEQRAEIRRYIIENSNKSYIIADHTKFDRVSFVNICGFENINAIIVDKDLSSEWKAFCKKNKILLYEG